MTLTVKHAKTSAIADDPAAVAAGEVVPSDWNADHTITGSIAAADVTGLATVATTGAYGDLSGRPTLATVATTGAYTDLSGKPTLATVATTGAYSDLSGKPTLATVATTGAYADLSGTPTINTLVPSQTGNSGKYLTTNGTSVSWDTVSGGSGISLAEARKTASLRL